MKSLISQIEDEIVSSYHFNVGSCITQAVAVVIFNCNHNVLANHLEVTPEMVSEACEYISNQVHGYIIPTDLSRAEEFEVNASSQIPQPY